MQNENMETPSGCLAVKPPCVDGSVVTIDGLQSNTLRNGDQGGVGKIVNKNGRAVVDLFPSWEKCRFARVNVTNLRPVVPISEPTLLGMRRFCDNVDCRRRLWARSWYACSNCKLVRYCSEDCQRVHWESTHKTECGTLLMERKHEHSKRKKSIENKHIHTQLFLRATLS